HLHLDPLLEQVVEHEQAFEQVAAEPVGFLNGEHVARTEVVERGLQPGAVGDGELAADLLLEHLHADRVEVVVLACGLLSAGGDPDQTDQRHDNLSVRSGNVFENRVREYLFPNGFPNIRSCGCVTDGRSRQGVRKSTDFRTPDFDVRRTAGQTLETPAPNTEYGWCTGSEVGLRCWSRAG